MATRKSPSRRAPASSGKARKPSRTSVPAAKSASRTTMSGPARASAESSDLLERKVAGAQALAKAMAYNENKVLEHGDAARAPAEGRTVDADPVATASTVTEGTASGKTGGGEAPLGRNPNQGPLDRVRVDATGRELTTNQGVPIADNQNSLKAGLRGPTLLEDFILREKITHFDHERIPERVVHARGSAAHGYFECYESLARRTRGPRSSPKPASARRSSCASRPSPASAARPTPRATCAASRSSSTPTKGNWDLVGNNIPVFFIQDAMKFPDLSTRSSRSRTTRCRRRRSAHDTFWDFVSLMPESTHMLMWVDVRPRHPAQLPDDAGLRRAHLPPRQRRRRVALREVPLEARRPARIRSVWDEAVKISGADPDFHRRDLWEAIEAGAYPGVGARPADLHRGAGGELQLRRARRDQDRPRGAGAAACPSGAWCSTATRTTSSPRRSRSRSAPRTSCPASTSRNDPLLARPHPSRTSTRRSRASAGRTSTRSRSTRRSRRSTTTSATACIARR